MKKMTFTLMVAVWAFTSVAFASYTYTIEEGDDVGELILTGIQNLLMTGGKCEKIYLHDYSHAIIENTYQHLVPPWREIAIWKIGTGDDSVLDIFDGSINDVYSGGDAVINVLGGTLHAMLLYNNSVVNIKGGVVEDGIHVKSSTCLINVYGYNFSRSSNYLIGNWADGVPFSLYLPDSDQIILHEVPDPATLLLLGFGGLLIRRK